MESSVNYDRPIEGDPMNNIYWIHDTHFACFAILEFPSINHRMLYLLKFRDRQIFLNPVFLEIFFLHFLSIIDLEIKKFQIKIANYSPLYFFEINSRGTTLLIRSEEENKFFLYSYPYLERRICIFFL